MNLRTSVFVLSAAWHVLCWEANVYAQFPIDSSTQKIVFKEVVIQDSSTARMLYDKSSAWIEKNFRQSKPEGSFDNNEGHKFLIARFLVYTKGIMSKEIHGAVRYHLTIDTKDGKYKYSFTDFVFEYYKIDRQFQYKPTGKEKPLEDKKFPGWEKPWANHKQETGKRINTLINSLQEAMKPQKIIVKEIAKPKNEW